MKVTVDELRMQPQHKMEIAFKETVSGLDAVKPVVGDLWLSLDSIGVRLSGRLQTLLKLFCHRCLQPYFQSLQVDVDERFVRQFEEEEPGGDRELLPGDFVEPLPADGVLDISDIVYQAVTLSTPTHGLCGQECPGTPVPPAGSNKASLGSVKDSDEEIDPRWKNLKTLFPKHETEEKS